MSSEQDKPHGEFGEPQPTGDPGSFTQEFQHTQVSARVPERVGRGVFCTGALVLQGPNEFVIDFLLTMTKPQHIAARLVVPPPVMGAFLNALNENYNNYKSKFGTPPGTPQPPPPGQPQPKPPSIEEIYDQLKLSEDLLSGVYTNAVMIVHTPAEFCLDFITNFYPRSAVACRVYMAAPQIPGLLNTLTRSYQQYQQKANQPQQPSRPHDAPPQDN
jgi:Protein of unknown function (DUF3467)